MNLKAVTDKNIDSLQSKILVTKCNYMQNIY